MMKRSPRGREPDLHRPAEKLGGRAHYVRRAMSFLKPYWPAVAGAYAVMLAANATDIWMPVVIGRVVDVGIRGRLPREVVVGCLTLLGLAIGRGLCTFLMGRWTETASQAVAFDIRNRFHAKLQSLSFSFHDEAETGQLLARSVSDVDRIRFLTGRAILHLVQMLTLMIGVSVAMILMNARLGLVTLTILPLMVGAASLLGTRLRPLSMRIRDQEARLTSCLEQNLHGARIVKAFGREAREISKFQSLNEQFLGLQLLEAQLRAGFLPLMQFAASLGALMVLIYGGRLVMRDALTLGELVAFMAYVSRLVGPARRIGWIFAAVAEASASAERIFEVLDLESDVTDAPGAVPLEHVRGGIEFEKVSFGYTRSGRILSDVSFRIEPGERVALLGGTGSGKSSITNLIPRFYDATIGRVLIDGVDVRTVTVRSLRDHIGIVFQDTVLFAASVRENIAFGHPGASEAEIRAAARAAGAEEFIEELPQGYETNVGEQGISLSGGQRQRIAIARALLKGPEILILDDATSSVDTETEARIQAALDTLMRGRTAIIIAHRLSTLRNVDKVIVLDRGRVAAMASRRGSESPHEQLLRTNGFYSDLVSRQLKESCSAAAGAAAGVAAHGDGSREVQ